MKALEDKDKSLHRDKGRKRDRGEIKRVREREDKRGEREGERIKDALVLDLCRRIL